MIFIVCVWKVSKSQQNVGVYLGHIGLHKIMHSLNSFPHPQAGDKIDAHTISCMANLFVVSQNGWSWKYNICVARYIILIRTLAYVENSCCFCFEMRHHNSQADKLGVRFTFPYLLGKYSLNDPQSVWKCIEILF